MSKDVRATRSWVRQPNVSSGSCTVPYWWDMKLYGLHKDYYKLKEMYLVAVAAGQLGTMRAIMSLLKKTKAKLKLEMLRIESETWTKVVNTILNARMRESNIQYFCKFRNIAYISKSVDQSLLRDFIRAVFMYDLDSLRFYRRKIRRLGVAASMTVNLAELSMKVHSLSSDEITKIIWDSVMERLIAIFQMHFQCIIAGQFPSQFKVAILILLKRSIQSSSKVFYRPLCLIDDIRKMFEETVTDLLTGCRMRPWNLSEEQFVLREGRVFADTITKVKELVDYCLIENRLILDLTFELPIVLELLPWERIKAAFKYREFPDYLQNVVANYLVRKELTFVDPDDHTRIEAFSCRYLHMSVLDPFCWDTIFDRVLKAPLPRGTTQLSVHTLILLDGGSNRKMRMRANVCVSTTQVLSAYGYFGDYLHRIAKATALDYGRD